MIKRENSIMIYQAPVYCECDVLILGGTTGAVEAALAAGEAGASVFCATPFTYFGEDICSHLRLWEDFTDTRLELPGLPTPMHVKHTLERALIDRRIDFLFASYPAWLLRGADNRVAGAIIANRSGFQAILANVIIDTTGRALAARMSGAAFRPFEPGPFDFTRIVAGAAPADASNLAITPLPSPVLVNDHKLPAFACTRSIHIDAPTPSEFARAEAQMRLATWHADQLLTADSVSTLMPDRLMTSSAMEDLNDIDLNALQCPGDPIFVLGPQANLGTAAIDQLNSPRNLMPIGSLLGRHCAAFSTSIDRPKEVAAAYSSPAQADVDIVRYDNYFRMNGHRSIPIDLNRTPELTEVDVLVAGGGTAGAPAGIAAGRAGAKTLILEQVGGLGGVGTEGRIACYYHGNRCGFTAEIDAGVAGLGDQFESCNQGRHWDTEWKRQWYLREVPAAGVEAWFTCITVAACRVEDRVAGVIAATPWGIGQIRAACVIDSSGNADVAAAAGAEVVNIAADHLAVQGTGLSPFIPGKHYFNSDYTFIDDTDIFDVTRAYALSREKFRDLFDVAQNVNSRQRRQIVGDLVLDAVDFLARRTYPDTITTARSNFDSHGFTIHDVFMALPPDNNSHDAHIPYRALLPKGLDGILVTGLGISCHRDALPVVRMQPDVQNQGYAAGRAAAAAAKQGRPLREIDLRKLQRHLVRTGILAPEVLTQDDSFPLPDQAIDDAIANGIDTHTGLAIIFAEPERSLPRLLDAYGNAAGERRVQLARILGLAGDSTGADTLATELARRDWDEGWNYRGMGQFGFSMSQIDTLIVALARSGAPQASQAIMNKLVALRPDAPFSHFRAITLALIAQPVAEAIPHIERLLNQPPIRGNNRSKLAEVVDNPPESPTHNEERSHELGEIHLARALWACGDPNGIARAILHRYADDVHGHYARHARALLTDARRRPSKGRDSR